jgi:siroheme synthase
MATNTGPVQASATGTMGSFSFDLSFRAVPPVHAAAAAPAAVTSPASSRRSNSNVVDPTGWDRRARGRR